MRHFADRQWKWVAGAVMVAWIIAGCAGMKTVGTGQMPAHQEQSAAQQEASPSIEQTKAQEASPPEPEIQGDYIHTVSYEGETLSLIAKWYTGRLNNWKELAAANPDIDPDRIFIGNEIVIPEKLLVTREPMPWSFIRGN